MPSKPNRILELDGLRAVAVGFVVLYHLSAFGGSLPNGLNWMEAVVGHFGVCGVNIFFVISGFIITRLLLREQSAFGEVSLSAFYIRRFFRIVPPFAAYLLVLFALGWWGAVSVSNGSLLWSGLFLGNTELIDAHDWFVAHTWSLSVEEQFYLIFPPLLCHVLAFRRRPILVFLGLAYAVSLLSLKLAHELAVHVHPHWVSIAGFYPFRYIIVGVVLALVGARVLAWLSDTPRGVPVLLALLVAVLRFISTRSHVVSLVCAALEPGVCGLFVAWFMQNPSRCAFLRWSVVQWIGACSYSIYLWQQLFTAPPVLIHGWSLPGWPGALLAILSCAALSRYLIELPGLRIGRMLSGRLRSPQHCGAT